MTREYPVIYEWAGKNFAGYAPDVAGCMATAKTLPLIRAALKGALEAHLQWMKNDGDPIPEPSETVTVDMEPDAEYPQPRGYHVIVERLGLKMPRSKNAKTKLTKSIVRPKRAAAKRRELTAA
jgi:predicted RNase H-like HicB family nuclease